MILDIPKVVYGVGFNKRGNPVRTVLAKHRVTGEIKVLDTDPKEISFVDGGDQIVVTIFAKLEDGSEKCQDVLILGPESLIEKFRRCTGECQVKGNNLLES